MCPHGFQDDTRCGDCAELNLDLVAASFANEQEIEKDIEETKEEHKVWDCELCEGNGFIACQKDDCDQEHDCEETDCPCHCHIEANRERVPEKPKTDRDLLDEMIAAGTAKKVKASFAYGSTIHQESCPYCKQIAIEVSRSSTDVEDVIQLECMHEIRKTRVINLSEETYKNIRSLSNKQPYPFQATGGAFLDACNGRGLIADEMGLGKTIQALSWLGQHKEAWPFIVVTKASLKVNWYREIFEWIGDPRVQILDASNEVPLEDLGFIGYIVSVDTIGRAEWVNDFEDHAFIKTVILDECQTIKNMNAKRTKAVRNLCQGKEHIIALSGTPIKNNAAEYFPILNILRPTKFPSHQGFIYKWVETYSNGYSTKAGGIKPTMLDFWNDLTKDFIIRRKREEVLPDLPKIMRSFQYHDLGSAVQKAYTQAFEDFMDASEAGAAGWGNTLAAMSRMRHLTGLAKIDPCVDYITDFLVQNLEEKICIFAHHQDVIGILSMKLDEILTQNGMSPCAIITGSVDASLRQEIIDEFQNNPARRVMILSTLAAGEGLNLQFVKFMVALERQWNPANEEQAEGRFSRIGGTPIPISALYLVAIDTIDEFFAKLVEQKRSFMASTLDGEEYKWNETNLMKELAEELRSKGRKPWMMQKTKH